MLVRGQTPFNVTAHCFKRHLSVHESRCRPIMRYTHANGSNSEERAPSSLPNDPVQTRALEMAGSLDEDEAYPWIYELVAGMDLDEEKSGSGAEFLEFGRGGNGEVLRRRRDALKAQDTLHTVLRALVSHEIALATQNPLQSVLDDPRSAEIDDVLLGTRPGLQPSESSPIIVTTSPHPDLLSRPSQAAFGEGIRTTQSLYDHFLRKLGHGTLIAVAEPRTNDPAALHPTVVPASHHVQLLERDTCESLMYLSKAYKGKVDLLHLGVGWGWRQTEAKGTGLLHDQIRCQDEALIAIGQELLHDRSVVLLEDWASSNPWGGVGRLARSVLEAHGFKCVLQGPLLAFAKNSSVVKELAMQEGRFREAARGVRRTVYRPSGPAEYQARDHFDSSQFVSSASNESASPLPTTTPSPGPAVGKNRPVSEALKCALLDNALKLDVESQEVQTGASETLSSPEYDHLGAAIALTAPGGALNSMADADAAEGRLNYAAASGVPAHSWLLAKRHIILLKGHPGVGKTSLGHQLAARLGFPVLDKDDVRDALLGCARVDGNQACRIGMGASSLQPRDANKLAYTVIFNMAASNLSCGKGVIIDSPASRENVFIEAERLARRWDAVVSIIEMTLSDREVWARRLGSRSEHDPVYRLSTLAQVEELIASYNESYRWSEQPQYQNRVLHLDGTDIGGTDRAIEFLIRRESQHAAELRERRAKSRKVIVKSKVTRGVGEP